MNHNIEQWEIKKRAVPSARGVVAAQNWMAAASGADILSKGGNAIDAAVACAFALNVVEPWMCGMGGSGYMVIWLADESRAIALDFQGMLPNSIDTDDYPLDPNVPDAIMGFPGVAENANVVGYKAIAVPGAVAGLSAALKHHGRLDFDRVLLPAIQLAERGVPIDWHATMHVALEAADLAKFPATAELYLPGGFPPQPERYLPLDRLTRTLKALAQDGPDEFYKGRIAEKIVADLQDGGSRIDADDLASYEPLFIKPLTGTHRDATLYTPGETSGGLRLNEALQYIEENLDLSKPVGGHTYVTYATALNQAFKNHEKRLGRINKTGCTSHMSTVDADGNMVALTYTLLNRFGSKVILPKTGILMNNSVSYFDPRPNFPTSMAARKRINASNMCPTVCVQDGQALFAVGASGANHIVPCTLQISAFLLDYGLSLEETFNLPRIDADGSQTIRVDPAIGKKTMEKLSKTFQLEIAQNLVFPKLYSCPSGVWRDPKTGTVFGISDKANPVAGAIAEGPFDFKPVDHIGSIRA